MRKEKIAAGEYYHLYNRGNHGEFIFLDEADRIRFLFLILYLQLPLPFANNDYHANLFRRHGVFYLHANREAITVALPKRHIDLISFALMPNHFHLVVCAREDAGISKYMQRVLNAYTKYFNTKHNKKGHLFEGPYHLVHVKSNVQLLHLSAYVHRNPREIREWKNKEERYPYSSFPDYVGESRWGELLVPKIILEQFKSGDDYKRFVETSSAKTTGERLDDIHLIED